MKSATQANETTNSTPIPTMKALPQEGARVITAVIAMSVVIAVILLLIAFAVIGILILKANTTTSYEFKPSSEKGMHACMHACDQIYVTVTDNSVF